MVEREGIMSSPREEEAVSRTIELLLDCGSPRERIRVLLGTLVESGFCESAALWRQVGRGEVRAWHPVLGVGRASILPSLEELRGVVAGELPGELGRGRFVILPIEGDEFALTIATNAQQDSSEEDLEAAEALFEVWLAVEVSEANDHDDDLLAALAGLNPAESAGSVPPTPLLGSPVPEVEEQEDLAAFLQREAAWLLGPSVTFELEASPLPELTVNQLELEACLRELLAGSSVGLSRRPTRVRASLRAAAPTAPGVLFTVEDDGGWIPSLSGPPSARRTQALFSAARLIDELGGSLRLDQGELGGVRVTVWLPAS